MGKGLVTWYSPDGEILFPVEGTLSIGSGPSCEIRVKEAAPRHCLISRTAEGFVVRDLTGAKLLTVNGTRTDSHVLKEGDVLKVASSQFLFSLVEEIVALVPEEARPKTAAPVHRIVDRPKTQKVPRVAGRKPRVLVLTGVAAALVLGAIVVLILLPSSPDEAPRTARVPKVDLGGAPVAPAPVEPKAAPKPAEPAPAPVEASAPPPGKPAESSSEPPPPLIRISDLKPDPAPAIPPPPDPAPAFAPEPAGLATILRNWHRPDLVSPAAEASARGSTSFAVRYAALLLQMHRAFAKGTGYEASYRALLEASPAGGPEGAAAHLKALAASLKEAIYCKECKNGRVTCPTCQGKCRVDANCIVCEGRGRVRPSGAIGDTDVSVKCRNCEGIGVFRGVGCGGCSRSGSVGCPSCKGSPWREAKCYHGGCKDGRLTCGACQGRGWEQVKCPFCVNGRARAPGAVGNADVTMKCRNCEINGQQGNGTFKQDCRSCNRSGKVTCEGCGGVFAARAGAGFRDVPISRVFRTEGCQVASVPGVSAHECSKCVGLGVRIRPAADPAKTLD